jgi:hypothetical protein
MFSHSRPLALIGGSAFALSFVIACSTTVTQPNFFDPDAGTSTSKDPTTGKPGSTGSGLCAEFCEKAKSANCSKQASCEADCKKQIESSPGDCKAAAEALITCAKDKGTFDGCSASGTPKLEGCDAETMAYLQCVQGAGKKDGGTTTTTMKCDELQTGDATCDACLDSSCCAQETACVDEPQCLAFYDCLGAGTPQATCQTQHPAGFTVASKLNQCMTTSCATPCQ